MARSPDKAQHDNEIYEQNDGHLLRQAPSSTRHASWILHRASKDCSADSVARPSATTLQLALSPPNCSAYSSALQCFQKRCFRGRRAFVPTLPLREVPPEGPPSDQFRTPAVLCCGRRRR